MVEQRQLFAETVKGYRRLCKHLLGILKLTCRKESEAYAGKSSRYLPRRWACLCDLLCDLWTLKSQVSIDTTTPLQQGGKIPLVRVCHRFQCT